MNLYRVSYLYRKTHLAPAMEIEDNYLYEADNIEEIENKIINYGKEKGNKLGATIVSIFLDLEDENGILPLAYYIISDIDKESKVEKLNISIHPDVRIKR